MTVLDMRKEKEWHNVLLLSENIMSIHVLNILLPTNEHVMFTSWNNFIKCLSFLHYNNQNSKLDIP